MLVGWLVGRLTRWLVEWSACWLIGWSVFWSVCLDGWLIGWLVGCCRLIGWSVGRLIDWSVCCVGWVGWVYEDRILRSFDTMFWGPLRTIPVERTLNLTLSQSTIVVHSRRQPSCRIGGKIYRDWLIGWLFFFAVACIFRSWGVCASLPLIFDRPFRTRVSWFVCGDQPKQRGVRCVHRKRVWERDCKKKSVRASVIAVLQDCRTASVAVRGAHTLKYLPLKCLAQRNC